MNKINLKMILNFKDSKKSVFWQSKRLPTSAGTLLF